MTAPGAVLAERYTIQRLAWTGIRGEVWKAIDRTLDRPVYLLVLDPALAADADTRRAFFDEASALATRSHPSIAAVYDIGLDPPFVVIEDPGGGRLSDRLAQGRLDVTAATRIISNLARALQAFPDGIEDLDPERILLAPDGRAKLAPLGVRTHQPNIPRPHVLAELAYRMLTGHESGAKRVRREVPKDLWAVLHPLLERDPVVSLEDLVTACAAFTRPETLRAARGLGREGRGGRGRRDRSDLGWLFGVTLIVALAVVAVVLGPRLIDQQSTPSPGPSATEGTPAIGSPLEVAAIIDFDPAGNGEEHPAQVARTLDGDPLTAWSTLGYRQAAMDKAGVGIRLDLGAATSINAVRIQTALPGWKGEIRVSDTAADTEDGYAPVASFTIGTDDTIALPKGTVARYVLIWLVELTDDEGESDYPYRASIAEVAVFG